MAEFISGYKAKGVLSNVDLELTETKKEGIFTHDLKEALLRFEGQDVTISISLKEEVEPKQVG
jgi:hypothetical protein